MKQLIEKIIPTLNFQFPYNVDEYVEHLYLENYHCHKDFTNTIIADCAEPITNYAKRIKEFGTKCLFSGEHGTQGNQFEVYKVAEAENLRYVHSTEAYWVKDRLAEYPVLDKETGEQLKNKDGSLRVVKDRTNCHIILVALNAEGRKDINYILSMANIDGYYYRPRIDLELLLQIPKDNIIVTSACIAGWNYPDAEDVWIRIAQHFKENFFLEVQYHHTEAQKQLNKKILRITKENQIQIICGLDTHYITDDSKVKRDKILEYKKIQYPEEEGWFMDYPDTPTIIRRFQEQGVLTDEEILRAIMNTNVFYAKCQTIIFDRKFKIPDINKGKTYEQRCDIFKKLLNQQYHLEKNKSDEKKQGIRYEVKEIVDAGVVDYFLVSHRIVDDAIHNEGGILTTTSRGSAASFITNKLLGLTTVDRLNADVPIYPERFLTKERVLAGQMPDIDLNVATQEPFVRATKKLLGENGCYPLMAVEKLKEKAAWQLYAGANDVEPAVANQISKYLDEYNKALKYADEDEKEFIQVEDYIPEEYVHLFRQSNDYQGITINLKCHACGHLLLDGDIRREIGLISAVSETTGKRTLCAAVEGGVLDEFGYVKEDFLIVDSVYLTYKFFHSIGEDVPSFDVLREMVNGDAATWEIYKKGITCCVNQCEKESTTNKVKKYQPQNIAELSSFIAGIRPGFASLLSTFLNRESYTTGEPKIDNLLEDTAHFMIYQESIMKVLSFLKLLMGETYGVIKSISKKKLKGEKKAHLLQELNTAWMDEFHNLKNFNKVWKVIEDSALYAFNAPHAYSMAGDSLYQAWFKAHHTAKFYEVAINHYQEKGNKDKIDALVKEAMKFYGYQLGGYKFGVDNRIANIDVQHKIIYPNLSSIKGFGEGTVNMLYQLGQNQYNNFIEVLTALYSNSINKTIVNQLIRIEYFSEYGGVYKLLQIANYYDVLYGAKQMSKEKITQFELPVDLFKKYGHETAKQFNKLDSNSILQEMVNRVDDISLTTKEILDNQHDVLGIVSYVDEFMNKRYYYVHVLDIKKSVVNVTLYEIYSGKTRQVKMWASNYNHLPFNETDILYITKLEKKPKKEPTGEVDPNTGKKIYRPVPDKFEYWLSAYRIDNEVGEVL